MEYKIARLFIGSSSEINLSEDDYNKIKSARLNAISLINIEQIFDLVVENYKEIEISLLNCSLNSAIHSFGFDNNIMHIERDLLNRKIMNFLSSCRSYIDQIKSKTNEIILESHAECETISSIISKEYDKCIGFRIIEALRNYSQHKGFPVSGISYNARRIDNDDGSASLRYATSINISVKKLKEDGKFKKSVLNEMRGLGEKLDLMPFVKEYISSLGEIQKYVRAILNPLHKIWVELISSWIESFKKNFPDDGIVGISAIAHDGKKVVEQIYIGEGPEEYFSYLSQKNRSIAGVGRRYVTNQSRL